MTAARRFSRDWLAITGLAVIAALVLCAALAPWLAPHNPDEQFFDGLTLEGAPLPPNGRFWLGTDLLGRDVLARLLYGARTSLVDRPRRQRRGGADRGRARPRRGLAPRLGRRRASCASPT